ncbi:MAG TPA: hypothetical protein VE225_01820, partial [Rubrobacteraceae bacterium]|nr:hypothetical protein [Rubrobacteraceae bacterium]
LPKFRRSLYRIARPRKPGSRRESASEAVPAVGSSLGALRLEYGGLERSRKQPGPESSYGSLANVRNG